MSQLIFLALGGAAGTLARYGLSTLADRVSSTNFPVGTLTVNALGSLLFGLVSAIIVAKAHWPPVTRLVLLTGFMGAFTTFSTYAHESAAFMQNGRWLHFGLHLLGHNVLGLILVIIGLMVGSKLFAEAAAVG